MYIPSAVADRDTGNTPQIFNISVGEEADMNSFVYVGGFVDSIDVSSNYKSFYCDLIVPNQSLVVFGLHNLSAYFVGACNLIEIYI